MSAHLTHRELLADLIKKLKESEQPFYELAALRSWWGWLVMAILGFAISAATAITAELIDGRIFDCWGKPVLTVLPIVATLVAAISHLFRFPEKEALREAGRIEIEDIIANAESMYIDAKDEAEMRKAFHSVRQRAFELERMQHRLDVALRSRHESEGASEAK